MESKLNSNHSLQIRKMKNEDTEEVSKLFADTFSRFEPLSVHLDQSTESFLPFAILTANRCSVEQLSYICEDTTNESGHRIVGFCLNETLNTKEIANERIDYNDHSDNNQIKALLTGVEKKWLKSATFAPDTKIFHLATVGVNSAYNNRGIASQLISASVNNAKNVGFDLVVVEATAAATQKIFKHKYNFRETVSQVYEEFEFNGKKVFEGLKEPKSVIVFEKELKDWPSIQCNENSTIEGK